jgi:hypothetical protein
VCRRAILRTTFRPRRFSRPRRLTPLPALRAYFIPQPCSGFALQGFIPRCGAVPDFPGLVPSCRCLSNLQVRKPFQSTQPRLQGLAPRCECGGSETPLSTSVLRAPHGSFFLLRVLPFHAVSSSFKPPSVHDLGWHEPAPPGPRRLTDAEFGWSR